jgi:hypothetical protein
MKVRVPYDSKIIEERHQHKKNTKLRFINNQKKSNLNLLTQMYR